MDIVGAALADEVDLRSGLLSILAAVGIGDDCRFFNAVLAEHEVGGTGVVQVQEGVHVVHRHQW